MDFIHLFPALGDQPLEVSTSISLEIVVLITSKNHLLLLTHIQLRDEQVPLNLYSPIGGNIPI